MRKLFYPITFPLSIIYGLITGLRNLLFDKGISKELNFEVALINVGNLAVGGTGKTPHTAYLLQLLSNKKTAVLSRGYGRGTKGYRLVNLESKSMEVGDEILMLKHSFPNTPMAVHENRALGITELLAEHPEIEIIILDDAFQHRHVKPKINLLLSEFNKPFFKDFVMPAGRLREWRSGYKRASALIFTKCPPKSNIEEFKRSANISEKPVFFSSIKYTNLIQKQGSEPINQPHLITAIANDHYIFDHLKNQFPNLIHHSYRDHHHFSIKELNKHFSETKHLICTEKDWIKMKDLPLKAEWNIWVQTISIEFENTDFDRFIIDSLQ